MPQRFYITLGAPTTAGGKVTSASSLLSVNGARTALEGDSVWCEGCQSDGVIALDAPREGARQRPPACPQRRPVPVPLRAAAALAAGAGRVVTNALTAPLVERVMAHFGRLDILVNNAAIAVQGKTVDDPALDTVNLDQQWQVNVMGTVAVTRAAVPVLADGGRIIFIGSQLGTRVPWPGAADYAGSKAALIGYAYGVARDLGRRNITANVVQPGVMPTDMKTEVLGEGMPDALLDMHAIRRIATLEEVAATVCFLAGPAAGYITGGVIDVAGGIGV